MNDDALQAIEARIEAQEIIMEILCGQLWAEISPQKLELVGQRYLRMLDETLTSDEGSPRTQAIRTAAQGILKNALIRAQGLRSTL